MLLKFEEFLKESNSAISHWTVTQDEEGERYEGEFSFS